MKQTAKKLTLLTVAGLMMSLQSVSYAQVPNHSSAPAAEAYQAETLKTPKETRAPSWQGESVALKGRDVVSFFNNDDGPVKGSKDHVVEWDNTKWRFASAENADLFKLDPNKYVPEFGGFCPVALADNKAKIGKSSHYTVIDDKLYLNYNRSSQYKFRDTPNDFLVRAQLNF